MDEWIIAPVDFPSCECQYILAILGEDSECQILEDKLCTFENCPLKIDTRPITPEWLEGMGATTLGAMSFIPIKGSDNLTFEDGVVRLTFYSQTRKLPIKTRREFIRLYEDLSGRGLGE